ncbi:TonB-dependent receptor [Bryobacterales bacterium F-183]|nr:TonB-dependent receptor [Bryobacterales bacterium F-183]
MSLRNSALTLAACAVFAVAQTVPSPTSNNALINGQIFDAANGQPVRNASVMVKDNVSLSAKTDTDGRYQLKVPAGKYTLLVRAENFLETEIEAVDAKAGEPVEASTVMAGKGTVTSVDVVEKVGSVAATAEAMLTERKLAAVVSDSISSDEIHNSTASDAAGALEKVTGISIVDQGYVYVRGLGERYSSTMLNSAMVPTTEPEKRVVSLDLFPAQLIDSIKVLKTYSPELPGEFSGGLVQMQTVEFPTAKVLQFSANFGFNSRTTFQRFASYPGGGRDFFGFDDGTRNLPGSLPENRRLFPGAVSANELQQIGRSFPNNWEPEFRNSMRPQQSYSLVGGGTIKRFGVVGAITFANRPQYQSEINRYLRQQGSQPYVFTNYEDFRSYNESARLGGVLNVAYRINNNHKIVLRNTLTRDTDKEAREFSGYDGGVDSVLYSQRLRWVERGMLSTSVEGDHAIEKFGNSLLKWQLTYSTSTRNEPDMREVFRSPLPNGQLRFVALGSSALRFSNDLQDQIWEPQTDFSRPFYKGRVTGLFKMGFRGTYRNRDFQARRFRFIPQQVSTLNLTLPSNQLFAPENIRSNGFQLVEFTRATDKYDASMNVLAGFAMVDLSMGPRWRVVGGFRIEDADIQVNTLDPLVPNGQAQSAKLVNRDPMPALNVIYALNGRQNLRFSYSQTVSRPDFRELSPFDFNNVLGGFVAQGNPNLVRAKITNYDGRWEWFLGGNELIAASFFYKKFTNPIEVTILPSNDLRQTYVNAAGANNRGLELEYRQGFRRVSRRLSDFQGQANFTFVDSDIQIRPTDAALLTSKNRPLLGQSRYIFNFISEWSKPRLHSAARFYVNYVSRRISDVGTFQLPDIYQEGNVFLDFNYQYTFSEKSKWGLKFNAENLGDNHYRWTQGDFLQRSYRLGRTFSVGIGYSIF